MVLNDKNQSIIHIFNHNYIVDGKSFVDEPIGVYADSLSHEMTFITAPKNNLRNINQIFLDCDIEIERLISKTFALGVELFNPRELQSGVVSINLESKKISLGLFNNVNSQLTCNECINNRKILSGIVELMGVSDMFDEIVIILDKLSNIGVEELRIQLANKGISSKAIDLLESFLSTSNLDQLASLLERSEIGTKGIDEMQFVLFHALSR